MKLPTLCQRCCYVAPLSVARWPLMLRPSGQHDANVGSMSLARWPLMLCPSGQHDANVGPLSVARSANTWKHGKEKIKQKKRIFLFYCFLLFSSLLPSPVSMFSVMQPVGCGRFQLPVCDLTARRVVTDGLCINKDQ